MSGSLYSAGDKAIFDALNQSKVTKDDIKELFLRRGVITSTETKRKDLAENFSKLMHGYDDYQLLADILGSISRREKSTVVNINSAIELDDIEAAAHRLHDSISSFDASSSVSKTTEGLEVLINYQTTNFNKSEFRQVVEKEAVIYIEESDSGFSIRSPFNDAVEKFKGKLIDLIEEEVEEELLVEEISLAHIPSPKDRTNFFVRLIDSLPSFKKHDVTDVFVFHPKETVSEDEGDSEQGDQQGIHISKASLKGEGVLLSDELRSLSEKGFYIWKIIWQAKRNSHVDSDIYEFEAQFSDPEEFCQFSYLVRGYYKYKGGGEFNKSRVQCSSHEEKALSKSIEKTAREIADSFDSADMEGTNNAEGKVVSL
ncbi:hypothetical protein KUV56_08845 [Ferrimonas balearica]|uniref:hypothetical protein n=1 Tax=Ferrimonas balearica TaxID=44012 RepID=UPI001C5855E6|nr:hypothetical protein [Ferrimonas balearica]MBW3139622.1 hypothetical protein [Ferrimonas balearica]